MAARDTEIESKSGSTGDDVSVKDPLSLVLDVRLQAALRSAQLRVVY